MLPHLMSPPYPQPRPFVQLKLQTLNIHGSLLGCKYVQQHHRFIKTRPNSSLPLIFKARNPAPLSAPTSNRPPILHYSFPKGFLPSLLARPHPQGQCCCPGNGHPLPLLPDPLGRWVCLPPSHLRREVPVSLLSSLSFHLQMTWWQNVRPWSFSLLSSAIRPPLMNPAAPQQDLLHLLIDDQLAGFTRYPLSPQEASDAGGQHCLH